MAKQDVVVEIFYSSAWHDVTTKVRMRDQITINHGAGDEQSDDVPSDASFTFDNRDGEMNPENRKSSLFGLIGHNTPVRITVSSDVRFSGQIVSWKPRRAKGKLDVNEGRGDAWVEIKAQGTIRRLGQGEPPVRSAMFRSYVATNPIAYWPLEDPSTATQAASGVNGVGPLILSGNGLTRFGGLSGPVGAARAADTSQTATAADVMEGLIPETSESSWRVEFSLMYRTTEATYTFSMPAWSTRGGVESWYLDQNESGTGLRLFYIDSGGITLAASASSVENNDGLWHLYSITGTQSGANIAVTVSVDGVTVISTTVLAHTFGTPWAISVDAGLFSSSPVATGVSHVVVWAPASAVDTLQPFNGFVGETAGNRFFFLCQEDGITGTVSGDIDETQLMGAQFADTFLNWIKEVAKTDAGIVHDTRDALGLTFRTGRSLYNQDPAVTLDFEGGQIIDPLEPDIDDLGRINFVIASRRNGGQVTATDEDGPLGTTAIGQYRSQIDINPVSDAVLPLHATYHLVLGTDPDPRYPQVGVDLTEQDASFVSDVAAVDIGDLIRLENLPADLGQPTADLLVLGYTEVIGTHTRTITFNTRPGGILSHVGQLDGDGEACLQTVAAHCSALAAETVVFNVATDSGPVFTTSPPTGAQILVGGREVMTVVSITGTTSPQTFRVTRDPDQRMAHASSSSVEVYRPLRLTL